MLVWWPLIPGWIYLTVRRTVQLQDIYVVSFAVQLLFPAPSCLSLSTSGELWREKKDTWPQQTSAKTGREKGTTLQPRLSLTITTMSGLASGFRQNQFYSYELGMIRYQFNWLFVIRSYKQWFHYRTRTGRNQSSWHALKMQSCTLSSILHTYTGRVMTKTVFSQTSIFLLLQYFEITVQNELKHIHELQRAPSI